MCSQSQYIDLHIIQVLGTLSLITHDIGDVWGQCPLNFLVRFLPLSICPQLCCYSCQRASCLPETAHPLAHSPRVWVGECAAIPALSLPESRQSRLPTPPNDPKFGRSVCNVEIDVHKLHVALSTYLVIDQDRWRYHEKEL